MVVDSQEIFELMEPILAEFLHTSNIVHCSTHQQAMDYVFSDQRADLIFADWVLSGHQFVTGVRNDLENHNTPIIIMSEDVRIKGIVLDETENRTTFFLSKPFLSKGLTHRITEVLDLVERRRQSRLRPQKDYRIDIDFAGEGIHSLSLVDISIFGCLFRMPVELTKRLSIYQQGEIHLQIDDLKTEISGELCRMGYDKPVPEDRASVLMMMKFIDTRPEHEEQLQAMLDELYTRW